MIGRIAGVILHRARDQVLIDVRGVGYVVHVSDRTSAGLPPAGQMVALYTDLLVREDLLQLFGFPTLLEKEWHRLLTSVQGVGAKVSLAVLGTLGADGLSQAIALGDWSAVRRAQGVGPKLAQRVVLELKDKAPAIMALGGELTVDATVVAGGADGPGIEPGPSAASAPASMAGVEARPPGASAQRAVAISETLSALVNLGYGQSEAVAAVAEAQAQDADAATPALIRAALRLLAPRG
ncbi:Holliday junction branch migration protein RuvA [Paracoccus spongiarum]|uniref:Holliday junction branch migration complex subunit RuvA n=1 Tax=Paracoccus spongiarum TaxID=3064387 RepID=A0ABT9JEQ0_9RHOB|nr:Holliday junction branch migration protein RuvA [Paracoccus sp. 2205BS29-5]MDP5308234.1 Holliday junction branch migration protein RuvA [Paracoccus sp. 2205BS29-5]